MRREEGEGREEGRKRGGHKLEEEGREEERGGGREKAQRQYHCVQAHIVLPGSPPV